MKPPKPTVPIAPFEQVSRLTPRDVAVLIPAYQPTEALIDLIDHLTDAGVPAILLVDDGNSASSQPVFELLAQNPRVHLLRHEANLGKGCALKSGMRYFLEHLGHYKGLVTADADGQHASDDVVRLARALHRSPRLAIMGARNFDLPIHPGDHPTLPPLRSLLGNRFTSALFRWSTGIPLSDAQSGLRALPTTLLPALVQLPGSRYEFEMAMLLYIARTHHPLAEQPIRTLYIAGNPTSHFRPISDSVRVLRALFAPSVLSPAPELDAPLADATHDEHHSTSHHTARAK